MERKDFEFETYILNGSESDSAPHKLCVCPLAKSLTYLKLSLKIEISVLPFKIIVMIDKE